MELQSARQIIDTLSQGIHPVTGEAMPADSPYNEPAVIRALFTVSRALQDKPARVPRELPPNAGKPWAAEEDARLEAGFAAGADVKQLAEQLGRTPLGVESRLVMRGKLPPRPGMRVSAPAAS
ncbi:MAG: hypothetical protein JWQ07_3382 [Ramlibacter sp.]|nr:hypothetical protein [Ramlibacter sp.]